MKIDHIFRNLNSFGGAEEHISSLAELQKAQGDDIQVCLISSAPAENQYVRRLETNAIPVWQRPFWLSRLISDWDTQEGILRFLIRVLSPLITVAAWLLSIVSRRPHEDAYASVEGRIRMSIRRFMHPRHERYLFLFLFTVRYYRRHTDVLHLHSYGAGLEYVLAWAHKRNIAVVYQEHSTPDQTIRQLYQLPTGLNLASVVVAVSNTSAQALRELCGVTRPIEVIPPIVVAVQDSVTERARSSENNVIHIYTIARLSKEKGLGYLIEAAEHVAVARPDVRFVIYGEGLLRGRLEAQIESAHLCDHVRLAGSFKRNQLPGIMNSADVFVLPSITEGLPLTIVEAMAWGLPIVATKVGGIPELLEENVTALLCPPKDSASLAHAIMTLLEHPEQAQKLGKAAREAYSRGNFRPECIVKRYREVYLQTLHVH